ncbi:MAG: hypothetical protein LC650_04925 [Actinobacteria bacterium]|nr:hypothetical protein [Actinomycetota bacterium]
MRMGFEPTIILQLNEREALTLLASLEDYVTPVHADEATLDRIYNKLDAAVNGAQEEL